MSAGRPTVEEPSPRRDPMPDLGDSLAPLTTALSVEGVVLLIWFASFSLAYNVGHNPTVRAVPSSWELRLAHLRGFLPRVAGPRTPETTVQSPWWRRLEHRAASDARAVDDAQDVTFWFPQLLAWALLPLAAVVVMVTASMPGDVGRLLWVLPTCVLLLNFTVFVATLVGRQRIWTQRATFLWRLYRTAALQHALLTRSRRRGERSAALEERVLHAARMIERELRHRFAGSVTGVSETVAARQWDGQVAELARCRAERLLAADTEPPLAWFENWLNGVGRAVLDPQPLSSDFAEGAALPRDDRPRAPLIAMFAIVLVVAGVGVLTTPASLAAIAHFRWDGVPVTVTVLVGLFTCANIGIGWIRKRRDTAS